MIVNKLFVGMLKKDMKVYVNNMLVNSTKRELHTSHLVELTKNIILLCLKKKKAKALEKKLRRTKNVL